MKIIFSFFVMGLLSIYCHSAMALQMSDLVGTKREFRSPNGIKEVCLLPRKWAGAHYTAFDLKKEKTLCSYDFYSNVGVCPKYSSTNPGLMIVEPNSKFSKNEIDSSQCELKKMGLKTDAKFKQSITCSYTPSILAYYHLSRILGDVGRVPPTVFRSLDLRTHQSLTAKAMAYLQDKNLAIKLSWEMLDRVHADPDSHPRLVDQSGTQMFGALSDNVRNEEKYTEVSGRGSYETRYERFLQERPYQLVSGPAGPAAIVGSRDFKHLAQTTLLMKDVSDMILIDTLLNQQDRIGNIHYKFVWYAIHPSKKVLERFKSKAKIKNEIITVPAEEERKLRNRTAVLLREMVLKDNDCGVAKTNMMRRNSALEGVRHISYHTYTNLLKFKKSLRSPSAKKFFTKDLLFTERDFSTLVSNTNFATQILQDKCRTGELKFDVDLEAYIPGKKAPRHSCG